MERFVYPNTLIEMKDLEAKIEGIERGMSFCFGRPEDYADLSGRLADTVRRYQQVKRLVDAWRQG